MGEERMNKGGSVQPKKILLLKKEITRSLKGGSLDYTNARFSTKIVVVPSEHFGLYLLFWDLYHTVAKESVLVCEKKGVVSGGVCRFLAVVFKLLESLALPKGIFLPVK